MKKEKNEKKKKKVFDDLPVQSFSSVKTARSSFCSWIIRRRSSSLRLVIFENGIWVSPGHLPSRQARRKSEPQDVHTVMCTFTFFHNSGRELMPSNDCFWRKKDTAPHCWPRLRKWYACVLNPTPDPGETGISVNSTAPWGQHVVKCVLKFRIGRVKSPHRKMF